MNLGAALSSLALNAGNAQIAGAEYADQQAVSQMHQMEALAMKQKVESQKAIAEETKQLTQDFQRSAKTADDTIKWAQQLSAISAAHGNFEMQDHYNAELKAAQESKKRLQEDVATEAHVRAESAAQAAYAYTENPTPQGAQTLIDAAQRAGAKDIPDPASPAFASWAVGQQKSATDSTKRLDLAQKDKEFNQKLEEQKAEKERADETKRLQLRQIALSQQQAADDRRSRLEEKIRSDRAEEALKEQKLQAAQESAKAKRDSAVSGLKLTADQKNTSSKVAGSMIEGVGDLQDMLQFSTKERTGIFAGMHGDSAQERLLAMGGRTSAGRDSEMLRIASGNLGRMALQAEVAVMGGRSPTETQMNHMQTLLEPQPGDDDLTVQYKLAKSASIFMRAYKSAPPPQDPNVAEEREKAATFLKSLPTTSEILEAAKKSGHADKLQKWDNNLAKAMSEAKDHSTGGIVSTLTDLFKPSGSSSSNTKPAASSTLPPGFKED